MPGKKSHPYFNIPNYRGKHGKKRVKDRWRKPKGIDNKKRIRKASYGAVPRVGYGNPPSLKHLHPAGLPEALIHNLNELEAAKGKIARLSSTLGRKKRLLLQQKAKELGITILGRVVE